jgi:hypothetical protein
MSSTVLVKARRVGTPPTTARTTRGARLAEHQAMTIAEAAGLIELGTAIDARRRSAPPANGLYPTGLLRSLDT